MSQRKRQIILTCTVHTVQYTFLIPSFKKRRQIQVELVNTRKSFELVPGLYSFVWPFVS